MKKWKLAKICMAACLAFMTAILPVSQFQVQAAEVIATVHGTVLSGTTSDLLLLSTPQGKMEIKLDSGTDTSGCKVLLPDKEIYVSVSDGSDKYLHAVKITTDGSSPSSSLDSSTTATVTGTLGEKTTSDILCLDTPQGIMEIKLDTDTNMSGCSVLIVGKTYTITCARGSDAYMHAVSISDKETASNTDNAYTGSNISSMSVKGTVDDRTKEGLLYLSTDAGMMQFKIDSNTDTSNGLVLTGDNKLTVYFYYGNNSYLHASSIVGKKDSASLPDIDSSNTVSVTGTVRSKSTENMLYLDTPQGNMELKLDALKSISNCKVLVSGKKITVTCAHGSDAYMHALEIKGV